MALHSTAFCFTGAVSSYSHSSVKLGTHPTIKASSPLPRLNVRVKALPGDGLPETKETRESPLVVCFGEMLIDFVPTVSGLSLAESPAFKKAPGGAPANVAVGIARLGGSSAFIGKVGADEFGYMLADILKENNVNGAGMRFDPGARTALAFVTLRSDGEREFMFYRNPSADMLLQEAELDLSLITKAKIFHYGSISLITEPCKSAHIAAAKAAKDAGVVLSYDPNLRLPLWPSADKAREGILSIWETADIIKISEEEISFLTQGEDPYDDAVVYKLFHANLKLLLVTEGPDGCRYYTKDFSGRVQGLKVEAVDATGAGDAFAENLSSVASRFGIETQAIIDVNGNNIRPFDTLFVPIARLPELKQPAVAPSAPPSRKTERKGVIIGLSIGLGICGASLVLVAGMWIYREALLKKKREIEIDQEKQKLQFNKGGKDLKDLEVNFMADVSDCLDKYRIFKIEELREATDNFSEDCLIQGSVYKGNIHGEVNAIKMMKWNASEELKILQKVNHGNLVKLEGFCIDPEDANCYLIYEYIENGSLHSWLHENKNENLNWKTRLRIAIDVANGLQYIHEHTRPRVVHKDIKSSNILLDSNMRAKIANFGLAKSGCNAITMHIVGTQGYIAPEYLADGVVSTKMDVFSFGVVLLELISGKEAIDEEGKVLWAKVEGILEGNEERKVKRVKEWMDEILLKDSISMESVMSAMGIAIACLHKDPSKRPSMVDIVYALSKSDDLLSDISDDALSSSQVSAR